MRWRQRAVPSVHFGHWVVTGGGVPVAALRGQHQVLGLALGSGAGTRFWGWHWVLGTVRGSARWRGELDNRWELEAIGMNAQTLKPGERLILNGSSGRNQAKTLYVWKLERPADGFWYEQVGMSPKIGFIK